jgi:hypothetical protein
MSDAQGLTQRVLRLTFTLGGSGTFQESGSNTLTVDGLRATAKITRNGGLAPSHLSLRVWGMTLSTMNQWTQLGAPIAWVTKNYVTVQAGDDVNGMTTVFTGQSLGSWVDANSAPDVALAVEAMEGQYLAVAPSAPVSYQGPVKVTQVLQDIAAKMGYTLEPNGVDITLTNPYYSGSLVDQAQQVARAANINLQLFAPTSVMAIWPKYGSRQSSADPPLISADGGMVGYPQHTQFGIDVKTLFNPNINAGGLIKVKSILTPASGSWAVYAMAHDLSSEMPGGPWFTEAQCYVPGQPTPTG